MNVWGADSFLYVFMLVLCLCGVSVSGRTVKDPLKRRKGSLSPESGSPFGAKPPDKQCTDFCKVHPGQCKHGGTCIVDTETCITSCVCVDGFSGRWCDIRARKSRRKLKPSTGSKNNSIPQQKHFLNIFNPSKGANINSTFRQSLHDGGSKQGWTSSNVPNISLGMGNLTKGLSHGFFTWGGKKVDTHSLEQPSNSSFRQRSCFPGFTCVHGYCDQEALKNKTMKCICEDNYVDTFCDKSCPLECGKHGQCGYVKNNTYQCVCEWTFTGDKCDQVVPDPIPHEDSGNIHWYVMGPSIGAIVVVLVVLIVIPYWMWKKRLVVVLKIVHYFQKYEDDDGKDYDAFVSYKATPADEKFVLQQLLPHLEGTLQYKLCLHFRDFLPGEAIANNIVKAIESSRRTIMVLSPSYVESEWCRMEYQKAQHEMLKLKHKIIPIMLDDISQVKSMDKNLKCILNSVTYIDWPGEDNSKRLDRFWKKLEYSLPKTSSKSASPSLSLPISVNSSMQKSEESSSTSVNISTPLEVPSSTVEPETAILAAKPTAVKKRKDLKYLMKFMFKKKFYDRQDSSCSQTALVDDGSSGMGSLDSCSDTQATEGTNSTCSTPEREHVTSTRSSDHGDVCSCGASGPGRKCSGLHGPVSFMDDQKTESYINMDMANGHHVVDKCPYVAMDGSHDRSGSYVNMDASGSYVDMDGSGLYIEMDKPNTYVDMANSDVYMDMQHSRENGGLIAAVTGPEHSRVYANMSDYTNSPPGGYVSLSPSVAVAYDSLSIAPSDVGTDASSLMNSINEKSNFCSMVCARRSVFTGKDIATCCDECKRLRGKSDYNRVRISVVSGPGDGCKIEKLYMEAEKCHACTSDHSGLKRTRSLQKTQKDELNRKLVRQNWVGSLGRHSGIMANDMGLTLNPESLFSYDNKSFVSDELSKCVLGRCYMDVCEKV